MTTRAELERSARAKELTPSVYRRLEELCPLSRRPRGKPKRVITIDIESKDGASQRAGFTRPFLTGLFDGQELVQWRNAPELAKRPWAERHLARGGCVDRMMRRCLSEEYAGARIYAHNGGAFDFLFCVSWLSRSSRNYKWSITPQGPNILALRVELAPRRRKKEWKPKGPVYEGPGAAPKRRNRKLVWTFIDSLRLLPMSLSEAAKVFGAPVQKRKMSLHAHERDARWTEYHADDLRALHGSLTAVEALLVKLGGEMALTAPSAALRLFQRRFLKRKVERSKHFPDCEKDECPGCAHAFVRKSYKGGRVEVFRLEGRKLYYFDINSSYPAAMLFPMPAGPVLVHRGALPRPLEHYYGEAKAGRWVGFCECTVRIPEDCALPPLPYHEPGGKLIFPVGTFSGVWDLAELELLREVGGEVVSIRTLSLYPSEPLFRAMVEELYPLRDKKRPGYQEGLGKLVKLILNALYGKFGQRPERTEVIYLPPNRANVAPEGAVPAGGDVFQTPVWYCPLEVDQPHIMPQISAHITSLARVRLWWGMHEVLSRGGRVYYLDTDSIVCDVELPSSTVLGKLKREYECPNLVGSFVRPKVYRLVCACRNKKKCDWYKETARAKGKRAKALRGQKLVCKGVPSRSLDPASFERFLAGGKVSFKRLAKLRTMAREGLRSPWLVATHKRMVTAYDKRIVLPDGSTLPIVLDGGATSG